MATTKLEPELNFLNITGLHPGEKSLYTPARNMDERCAVCHGHPNAHDSSHGTVETRCGNYIALLCSACLGLVQSDQGYRMLERLLDRAQDQVTRPGGPAQLDGFLPKHMWGLTE